MFEASRIALIKASPVMAISQLAREMKASGESVIDLGLGEPDFKTPSHIIETACVMMQNEPILYSPSAGTSALREAIVGKFERDNSLRYSNNEIAVAGGAKQVLF